MTFNEFVHRLPDFSIMDRYAARKNNIGKKRLDDISHTPFLALKQEVPKLIEEGKFLEAIAIVFDVPVKKVKRHTHYHNYQVLLWVLDQYKRIKLLEQKYLTSPPDQELINAGIHEMDQLGNFAIIDMLVEKYSVYTHQEVAYLPYSTIFDMQMKMAIERKITKRLKENSKK